MSKRYYQDRHPVQFRIEETRYYIIANATPHSDVEEKFIKKYKMAFDMIFDPWHHHFSNDEDKLIKELMYWDQQPLAEIIFQRECKKRSDNPSSNHKDEQTATRKSVEANQQVIVEQSKPQTTEQEQSTVQPNIKANVFLATVFSIVSLLGFYLSYGILNGILSIAIYILLKVPVLETLIKWIVSIREDTLDGFTLTIALFFSLLLTYWLISRITKNECTMKLTMSIFGVLLIVLNALALIGSFISNGELYSYIVAIIAGISFLCQGRKK